MSRLNFKQVTSQADKIINSIKEGKLSPIYMLMGSDGYYIDKISNFIANNVLTPDQQQFNQIVIYGRNTDGGEVAGHARRYPMMSNHQVVIVREAQAMSRIDQLAYYFEEPLQSTILVICHKEKSLDKRSKLYKALTKSNAEILETITPRDYEISDWISDLIKAKGCKASPKAVQMIVGHLGTDLAKIDQEITKLLTRLPENTKEITEADIEENIGISKDFNVFELTAAISNRDFLRALTIAQHFAANPKDNPIQVTLSLLSTHFQRIITLNIHQWECRRKNRPLGSDLDLAKLLKLPNPFFVNEYTTAAKNYPGAKASAILSLIREWDMKSKGMNVGSGEEGSLLEELILRISAV